MLDLRTKIGEGGRLIIPVNIRKELHLNIGDEVILKVKEGELHVMTAEQALSKLQEKIKNKNAKGISLVGTLLTMRREEQAHEK